VFLNLEAGSTVEEIIEQFDVTHERMNAVLESAARSLDPAPATFPAAQPSVDGHSV
jgi:uncharacterized protein (DUF433 family)